MSGKRAWREDFKRAVELMNLARAYVDDGAYLTAADRLEIAAKHFREGHAKREADFFKAVQP